MKFTLYSTKGNDIYTIYTAEREKRDLIKYRSGYT